MMTRRRQAEACVSCEGETPYCTLRKEKYRKGFPCWFSLGAWWMCWSAAAVNCHKHSHRSAISLLTGQDSVSLRTRARCWPDPPPGDLKGQCAPFEFPGAWLLPPSWEPAVNEILSPWTLARVFAFSFSGLDYYYFFQTSSPISVVMMILQSQGL